MECYPLRSDVASIGSFESSSDLLNSIHALDRNTAEANMMSVGDSASGREAPSLPPAASNPYISIYLYMPYGPYGGYTIPL